MFSDRGRSKKGNRLKSEIVAFKYKMSSIQAAMGIAQVKKIKNYFKKKRKNILKDMKKF